MFEKLHSLGYLFNDLKQDNICLGNLQNAQDDEQYHNNFDFSDSHHLILIDFGVATKFAYSNQVTGQLDHIPFATDQEFSGNIAFCSPNAKNL